MPQEGAIASVRRFVYGEEAGLAGVVSVWIVPNAYQDLAAVADYTQLPDNRQLGKRKAKKHSHKGPKITTFSVNFKLTEDTDAMWGPWFEAALGKVNANANLAINGAGTNTASVGTILSGVPDPVVKTEYNSGPPDYLPVKIYDGTTITWAIQNRKGARTITAYKNTTQCGGHSYQQDPTASLLSFSVQIDQGDEPNAESYLLQGLVPRQLELQFATGDRVGFALAADGSDWDGPHYDAAEIDDPEEFGEEFIGTVWDVHLQPLDTPSAPVQLRLITITGVNLTPSWIRRTFAKGRTATGTVPGSDIGNWRQNTHFDAPLVLTVDPQDTDPDWVDDYEEGTELCLHLVGYSGDPGDTAGPHVITITFAQVVIDKKPTQVDTNGVLSYQIVCFVEESLDTTHQTQCSVNFFNS
jgi:hypothetical protein